MKHDLTERQKRERQYYDRFSLTQRETPINFDPVLGAQRRPWNPYWYVYQRAGELFESGKRMLLDFGCGSGAPTMRLAKIGFTVCAFDISDKNIAIARQIAQAHGLDKRIEFTVQTAEHLNYKNECFDVIVGFDILHHVEIVPAISEIYRVLKFDGIAIFKEHIEAPLFDNLRRSRLITALCPNDMSFERHVTHDEKKLTDSDVKYICSKFTNNDNRYFTLISRIDPFLRRGENRGPSFLEKLDYTILNCKTGLSKYCGTVVLILKK
jgi:2-polyprenyl-3-methyl-5-hydroxy-6-metoxy-1,4-benzoquinol methylase